MAVHIAKQIRNYVEYYDRAFDIKMLSESLCIDDKTAGSHLSTLVREGVVKRVSKNMYVRVDPTLIESKNVTQRIQKFQNDVLRSIELARTTSTKLQKMIELQQKQLLEIDRFITDMESIYGCHNHQ